MKSIINVLKSFMGLACKSMICFTFALGFSRSVACQRGPIPPNSAVVQEGISTARTIINNISVTPGQAGWVDKLARKLQMSICLSNFERMLKKGKVIGGDPRLKGSQAAATPEVEQDGQAIRTTGVGVGGEEILLGPSIPTAHPIERGQKFIHEGARVKQRMELTVAALLPNNGGPGGSSPPGERCAWLRNEFEVYNTDADFYQEAADQAQAAGANAEVVDALRDASERRRKKASALAAEIDRDC
jgi:hypothetical protein